MIVIPEGCYRQPTESEGKDSNGNPTFSYVLKGPYGSLSTLLSNLKKGDKVIQGWVMSTGSLIRNPGELGTLTITCAYDANASDVGTDDENKETSDKALDETWTLKSVRNDVSILAYCGHGADTPCREWIEAWQKEPDGKIAALPGFTRSDGSIFIINEGSTDSTEQSKAVASIDLIQKIKAGIESVMRFYPQLTRTRTYDKPPTTVYQRLAMIDTPAVGTTEESAKIEKPGNLADIIAAHVWLKCQDDCVLTGDGKYQRIESWMGVLSKDGGWDENLYGNETMNRWPMPYHHTQNADGK